MLVNAPGIFLRNKLIFLRSLFFSFCRIINTSFTCWSSTGKRCVDCSANGENNVIMIITPLFHRCRRCLGISLDHHNDVIMRAMASQITSLTIVYSTVIQAQIKENIKAPRHWPLWGNSPVTGEFPAQRASNAENVSIWWRHHVIHEHLYLV